MREGVCVPMIATGCDGWASTKAIAIAERVTFSRAASSSRTASNAGDTSKAGSVQEINVDRTDKDTLADLLLDQALNRLG